MIKLLNIINELGINPISLQQFIKHNKRETILLWCNEDDKNHDLFYYGDDGYFNLDDVKIELDSEEDVTLTGGMFDYHGVAIKWGKDISEFYNSRDNTKPKIAKIHGKEISYIEYTI